MCLRTGGSKRKSVLGMGWGQLVLLCAGAGTICKWWLPSVVLSLPARCRHSDGGCGDTMLIKQLLGEAERCLQAGCSAAFLCKLSRWNPNVICHQQLNSLSETSEWDVCTGSLQLSSCWCLGLFVVVVLFTESLCCAFWT